MPLGEPPTPRAWCYLALHLLNLRGREGHSVLQLQQLLVCGPAGLHEVLRVLGGGFLSVRLARSHAHLREGSTEHDRQQERRQGPPQDGPIL